MAVHLSPSLYLRADGLSVSYAHRRVFTDLGFTVAPGQRLGLIGENGVGKSTLLRLLAGADGRADAASAALGDATVSGRLSRPARTGLLAQELPFRPDDRVGDVLEAALAEVRAIERELDAAATELAVDASDERAAAASAARYSSALDAAERADVWSADSRRDEVLVGLGVAGLGLDRRIDEVSGGQRTRFALAALLLSAPDALLLDEPTNHLDDDAASFLEERLRAWRGPVLFASHDREFLDRVATGLLDLDPGRGGALALAGSRADAGTSRVDVLAASGGTVFGGGFSEFLTVKAEERERWRRQYEDEQDELRRLRTRSPRPRATCRTGARPPTTTSSSSTSSAGTSSRRCRDACATPSIASRRSSASRCASRRRRSPSRASRRGRTRSRRHPACCCSCRTWRSTAGSSSTRCRWRRSRGSSSRGRTARASRRCSACSRARRRVDRGVVHRRKGLRVQLLEQDVRFADPDASPRRLYERVLGERRAEQVPLAGLGLIARRDESRPVGSLSVGQQRRLALALVIARPPHVFLLDEPTNHLSLALATDLEEALGTYPGAVVIASHDRWLRRRWAGERLELAAGRAAVLVE